MRIMEMFMLAAVNTENGKLYNYGSYLNYGLSGIAVVELISQGKLALEDGKLIVTDSSSTRDELLDETLQVVADRPAQRKLASWVMLLPHKIKKQDRRVMERLEDNGILRIEHGRLLGLFPSVRYIVTNETERDRIVNACREILLKGERAPAHDMMLVISMAAATNCIDKFFTKEERRSIKDSVKQVKKGTYFEAGSTGMSEVVSAIQKAITAAQVAAT